MKRLGLIAQNPFRLEHPLSGSAVSLPHENSFVALHKSYDDT